MVDRSSSEQQLTVDERYREIRLSFRRDNDKKLKIKRVRELLIKGDQKKY